MTDSTQTDDSIAYVDSIHQRSGHGHLHLRTTDECLQREAGERCPTWRERAERAEAIVALVEELARCGPFLRRWIDDSQLIDRHDLVSALRGPR